jgi:hypothetical protein
MEEAIPLQENMARDDRVNDPMSTFSANKPQDWMAPTLMDQPNKGSQSLPNSPRNRAGQKSASLVQSRHQWIRKELLVDKATTTGAPLLSSASFSPRSHALVEQRHQWIQDEILSKHVLFQFRATGNKPFSTSGTIEDDLPGESSSLSHDDAFRIAPDNNVVGHHRRCTSPVAFLGDVESPHHHRETRPFFIDEDDRTAVLALESATTADGDDLESLLAAASQDRGGCYDGPQSTTTTTSVMFAMMDQEDAVEIVTLNNDEIEYKDAIEVTMQCDQSMAETREQLSLPEDREPEDRSNRPILVSQSAASDKLSDSLAGTWKHEAITVISSEIPFNETTEETMIERIWADDRSPSMEAPIDMSALLTMNSSATNPMEKERAVQSNDESSTNKESVETPLVTMHSNATEASNESERMSYGSQISTDQTMDKETNVQGANNARLVHEYEAVDLVQTKDDTVEHLVTFSSSEEIITTLESEDVANPGEQALPESGTFHSLDANMAAQSSERMISMFPSDERTILVNPSDEGPEQAKMNLAVLNQQDPSACFPAQEINFVQTMDKGPTVPKDTERNQQGPGCSSLSFESAELIPDSKLRVFLDDEHVEMEAVLPNVASAADLLTDMDANLKASNFPNKADAVATDAMRAHDTANCALVNAVGNLDDCRDEITELVEVAATSQEISTKEPTSEPIYSAAISDVSIDDDSREVRLDDAAKTDSIAEDRSSNTNLGWEGATSVRPESASNKAVAITSMDFLLTRKGTAFVDHAKRSAQRFQKAKDQLMEDRDVRHAVSKESGRSFREDGDTLHRELALRTAERLQRVKEELLEDALVEEVLSKVAKSQRNTVETKRSLAAYMEDPTESSEGETATQNALGEPDEIVRVPTQDGPANGTKKTEPASTPCMASCRIM